MAAAGTVVTGMAEVDMVVTGMAAAVVMGMAEAGGGNLALISATGAMTFNRMGM